MLAEHIDKVKAEVARLKDMQVRLEDVFAETEDEMGALEDGRDDLISAIEHLTETIDFAEGRKKSSDVDDEIGQVETDPDLGMTEHERLGGFNVDRD